MLLQRNESANESEAVSVALCITRTSDAKHADRFRYLHAHHTAQQQQKHKTLKITDQTRGAGGGQPQFLFSSHAVDDGAEQRSGVRQATMKYLVMINKE